MRFRLGLVIGFGSGYYLGSMAGRERYEQINRTFRQIKRSDTFDTVTEKAKEVADVGVDRAKDLVDSRMGNGGDFDPAPPTDPYLRPSPDPLT